MVFGVAQQGSQSGAQRFATLELALAEESQITAKFGVRSPTSFDTLLALRERDDMPATVALYQTLRQQQVALPPYATAAAAEAYLVLHQPERAVALLHPLLPARAAARGELKLDAAITLAYALLESNQPDDAIALIDQLLAATPQRAHRGLAGIEHANPDYLRLAVQAVLFRIHAQRLDDAQQRLLGLQALAPFSSDVRQASASLHNARDHRHAAMDEYRLMLVDHPDSIDAAIGKGEVLLALNATHAASLVLKDLQAGEPDQRTVRHLAASVQRRRRPVLHAGLLVGHGGAAAGAESVFDATFNSAQLDWTDAADLRAFGHWSRASGGLRQAVAAGGEADTAARNRLGAGLTAASPLLSLQIELDRADGTARRTGVALGLASSGSDQWQLASSFDSNLNTLSSATYRAFVTARQWQSAAVWSDNEARKAGLEMVATDFSDTNRRRAARLWWQQRWFSSPQVQLDTTLSLAAARNSKLSTPYFNPANEREVAVATKLEWRTWQRYQRSFRQRLVAYVAQYRQQGFGSAAASELHAEHEWQIEEGFGLTLGLGHGFHPFDGVREHRRYGYLNINWIIQ